MYRIVFILICFICILPSYAQVGISEIPIIPNQNSILEIQSDDKGILIPRLSTSNRLNIDPMPDGLLVYDKDLNSFWYCKSNSWIEIIGLNQDKSDLAIDIYNAFNNLNPIESTTGLNYIIENPGTSPNPDLNSNVTVNYTGKFLNGEEFYSGIDETFPLNILILGWQEGLQLIGTGGVIKIIIPAYLAYGENGAPGIEPYIPLIFDIELISFN